MSVKARQYDETWKVKEKQFPLESEGYQFWIDKDNNSDRKLLESAGIKRRQHGRDYSCCSVGETLHSVLYTDAITKLLVVIFCAIFPFGVRKRPKKLSYAWLSVIFTVLQGVVSLTIHILCLFIGLQKTMILTSQWRRH